MYFEYEVQCTSKANYQDCAPTHTPASTTTPPAFTGTSEEELEEYLETETQISWRGWGFYHSPGIYCPSGWETIGMVARDTSSALTSSGFLAPTTTTSTRTYNTVGYYDYQDAASVMKSILEPRQTMALCCPRYVYLLPPLQSTPLNKQLNQPNKSPAE
jgi:hypothetical protein